MENKIKKLYNLYLIFLAVDISIIVGLLLRPVANFGFKGAVEENIKINSILVILIIAILFLFITFYILFEFEKKQKKWIKEKIIKIEGSILNDVNFIDNEKLYSGKKAKIILKNYIFTSRPDRIQVAKASHLCKTENNSWFHLKYSVPAICSNYYDLTTIPCSVEEAREILKNDEKLYTESFGKLEYA